MNLLALKLLPWKLIGTIGGAVAVVAVLLWYRHSLVESGEATGRAHVQKQWDAERGRIKAATDAQKTANAIQDAADEARNQEKLNEYEKLLAAADAGRSRLERQLRNAIAAASRDRGAAEAADQPEATGASPPGGTDPVGAALAGDIADLLIEARQNADQLDALREQIIPQM